MAVTAFPTYAYNATAAPQLVQTQAALTALGSTWVLTPFASTTAIAPADPGLTTTDIRAQQSLVEQRITNQYLFALTAGQVTSDDPQALRTDVLATDTALTS